jgi:hypothetical protein
MAEPPEIIVNTSEKVTDQKYWIGRSAIQLVVNCGQEKLIVNSLYCKKKN